MKTKTTNQRVVSRQCESLHHNQSKSPLIKKFFAIRLVTILMTALLMSGMTYSQRAPVNLGTADNFAVLTKSGVSTIPPSSITGDIGVSPIDQTAITGFSLVMDPSNVFATSTQVTGKVYAADFADPTPFNLTTAVGDMETAYNDAAGRTNPDFTELGAGEIGGLTLVPGLYKWSTDLLITNNVTLNGSSNDVWIFQVAGGITLANGTSVILTGGALAKNIFWQCAGIVSIGTTAHFEGIVLTQTSISMGTGASLNGILLAQTAVTLDGNAIIKPSGTTGVEAEFNPNEFTLSQNYPNPFNPTTNIHYNLGKAGMVSLRIYNLLGSEVAEIVNGYQEAGSYIIEFNTSNKINNIVSGVYFYRLETESFSATKKLLLLK